MLVILLTVDSVLVSTLVNRSVDAHIFIFTVVVSVEVPLHSYDHIQIQHLSVLNW